MAKTMGDSDVLRCLAKNIIYRPTQPGNYECDASCDMKCAGVGSGRANDLCLALRKAINNNLYVLR